MNLGANAPKIGGGFLAGREEKFKYYDSVFV